MSTTMSAQGPWSGDPTAPAGGLRTVELPRGATVDGGRYRVEEVLGQGGFGITYVAEDTRLHRSVAIKELFPPDCVRIGDRVVPRAVDELAQARFERCRARFVGEAENLARFAHVGIVRIYELVEERGTAYVVMERLCGRTLSRLVAGRGGRLAVDEAVKIAEQMVAALSVVHEGGLLHRDIKPDNVIATDDGRIVLVDFGAARQFLPDMSSTMTQVLTPRYAPLEQYSTHASFGPATDVYGLAATFYRLVAGDAPPAAIDRLRGTRLVPLAELDRRVPPAISAAVAHGLALEPGDRPQTAAAFLAALHGHVPSVDQARPTKGLPAPRALLNRATATVRRPAMAPRPRIEFEWASTLLARLRHLEGDVAASLSRAAARLPWPVQQSRRAPAPIRAWLPALVIVAAVASVAPVHAIVAVVLLILPVANALTRTRRHYRGLTAWRGRRWHDPVTRPVVFVAETGRAAGAIVTEVLVPLGLTAAGVIAAYIGLGLVDHGDRPIAIVRVIAAAAAVSLVVALVRRLQRHARFSPNFGADLVAPLVAPGGRLSSAGRVAWMLAIGLSAWVIVLPPWTVG